MKKGDLIEKRKELENGRVLIRNCPSQEYAEEQMLHINKYYNFREIPKMHTAEVEGGLCVCLSHPSYLVVQAKVNWVVEPEFAIEYLNDGGMTILNLNEPEGMGWVVIQVSTPVYQDSVEHMTDEELRASIEGLRASRLNRPAVSRARSRTTTTAKVVSSPEEVKLASLLSQKTPEQILEIRRKLGLCD